MGHHAGLTITSLAHRSLESYVGAQGEGLRGAREFGWSECPRVGHGFWISSTKSHVQHFCALECPQSVIEFILLFVFQSSIIIYNQTYHVPFPFTFQSSKWTQQEMGTSAEATTRSRAPPFWPGFGPPIDGFGFVPRPFRRWQTVNNFHGGLKRERFRKNLKLPTKEGKQKE